MYRLIVIGNGGLAKQLSADLFYFYKDSEVCFLNDLVDNFRPKDSQDFIIAVSESQYRRKIANKYNYLNHVNLISKTVFLPPSCKIGKGVIILREVIIEPDVKIGDGTLINVKSNIFHDVSIGEFCQIAPCVNLLGGCSVGNDTFIGCNATILPNIKIGNNVKIGAGAVVTKDIPDNCTAIGVPAKILK